MHTIFVFLDITADECYRVNEKKRRKVVFTKRPGFAHVKSTLGLFFTTYIFLSHKIYLRAPRRLIYTIRFCTCRNKRESSDCPKGREYPKGTNENVLFSKFAYSGIHRVFYHMVFRFLLFHYRNVFFFWLIKFDSPERFPGIFSCILICCFSIRVKFSRKEPNTRFKLRWQNNYSRDSADRELWSWALNLSSGARSLWKSCPSGLSDISFNFQLLFILADDKMYP